MKVKLVSLTKSMIEEADLNSEELITYTARVSNPSNQLNTETSDKLLAFLTKNKHWSPFEMSDMCVEITTSRGIAQQILRHRSFSFQEFSQRYAEVTNMEPIQLRLQAEKNRQSSTDVCNPRITVDFNDLPHGDEFSNYFPVEGKADELIELTLTYLQALYKGLLNAGVAKECARFVLPITTETTIYMKGSLRSWIHYLQIRTSEHTQLEHQQIALAILDILKEQFPSIYKGIFQDGE